MVRSHRQAQVRAWVAAVFKSFIPASSSAHIRYTACATRYCERDTTAQAECLRTLLYDKDPLQVACNVALLGMSGWSRRTAGFRRGLSENLGFRGSKVVASHFCLQGSDVARKPGIFFVTAGKTSSLHVKCFLSLQNLAAWGVAGILTYYIWIKPERQARAEQEVRQPYASMLSVCFLLVSECLR